MRKRGYVLIFFFWAFLSFITPTLIYWSVVAQSKYPPYGEIGEVIKVRRMMVVFEEIRWRKSPLSPLPPPPSPPPPPLQAPAPVDVADEEDIMKTEEGTKEVAHVRRLIRK